MEPGTPPDLVADLGHLFLGSRLKRLAERLQTDAAKVHRTMGIDAQPAEGRAPGRARSLRTADRLGRGRERSASVSPRSREPRRASSSVGWSRRERRGRSTLTRSGRTLVAKAKTSAWPLIDEAVSSLCAPLAGTLLEQLTSLERQLAEQPLEARRPGDRIAPLDALAHPRVFGRPRGRLLRHQRGVDRVDVRAREEGPGHPLAPTRDHSRRRRRHPSSSSRRS